MKNLVPTFDEFLTETSHREPVPKNIPALTKAFLPGARFEDKKGVIYKILSNDDKQIQFVQLDFKGNDTDKKRVFGSTVLAKLFMNREFFFSDKHRRDV